MLFEQLPDVPVSLTEREKSSRGNDSTTLLLTDLQYHLSYTNTDQHNCQLLLVESAKRKDHAKALKL